MTGSGCGCGHGASLEWTPPPLALALQLRPAAALCVLLGLVLLRSRQWPQWLYRCVATEQHNHNRNQWAVVVAVPQQLMMTRVLQLW